jgi:serine/threonine-protein kinase
MAKRPADRYQSAAEMLADLAKIRALLQPALGTIADENAIALPRVEESAKTATGNGVAQVAATGTSTVPRVASWLYRPRTLLFWGMLFMFLGAILGWWTRPTDLPAGELGSRGFPGLGMEPRWALIPRQASAEEQYRYAQLRAADLDLAAAWLAVPGFHAHSPEWISPAYLQLSRRLYRQGDQDRLAALKGELAAWQAAKTRDQELTWIIDCGLKLLNKDLEGVLEGMSRISGPDERGRTGARDETVIHDPGLLEFSVEILADALKLASQPGPQAAGINKDKLAAVQYRLVSYLRRVRMLDSASR